jgi:hypothetical protein
MTPSQVRIILARHGLRIEHTREGAGKFRDLEIGTGAPYATLNAAKQDLEKAGIGVTCTVTHVTNNQHHQYGKPYLSIQSFWCDDEPKCTLEPTADELINSPAGVWCKDRNCPQHGERNKDPIFQL